MTDDDQDRAPSGGPEAEPAGHSATTGAGAADIRPPPSPPVATAPPRPDVGPSRDAVGAPAMAHRTPVREMRVGEMLDAAVSLYRQHWRALLAVAAVVVVPVAFLQTFLVRGAIPASPFNPADVPVEPEAADSAAAIGLLFSTLNFLVIQPLLTGAVARAAADAYAGTRPGLRATYRFALSRFGAILWVTVLTALAVFGGFLLLVVPGVIFYVRFTFAPVVVVVEDGRGTGAMRRSWRLAKGHFWKIVGTLVLAGILTAIAAAILQVPLTIAGTVVGSGGWPILALGAAAAGVITRPFAAIVTVLLYFDMRIRKEGLDLALEARDAGLPW